MHDLIVLCLFGVPMFVYQVRMIVDIESKWRSRQ